MQSSAALALELDVSEDVIEEDIVLTEDTEEESGLVVDETAPESEEVTVEDDVQSITVQDTATSGTCGTDLTWAFSGDTIVLITHDNNIAKQAQRSIHILDGQISEVTL